MHFTNRLLAQLVGLLLLACSIPVAQSQNDDSSIAPTPVYAESTQNDVEPLASSAAVESQGTASENAIQPSGIAGSESLSASTANNFILFSSAADSFPNSVGKDIILPASEIEGNFASSMVYISDYFSGSEALASMVISGSQDASAFFQSSSMDIQPSESVKPADAPSGISPEGDSQSASVQQTFSPDYGLSYTPSLSMSGVFETAVEIGSETISPSATASLPSSTVAVPVPGGGESSPKGKEDRQEGGGGGGGMSSGAKAAVGIFVTLAIIGLIALVVVLYRRNYFNPRNLKALMKGGVRYQTHDDSMSYNDEGMLILPDRS
ncbi:hypothetical protein RRG08_044793 [Elysia crispata]|uniref:Uncharacterized protein n=1 Tax=Elysia crispata TaxID=231223 RepID=A0AAE0ZVP8_9GAST|nr:hypothetical protein RRG08_044793 [Elysia crispata]